MSISDSITRMEILMAILERLKEEAEKEEKEDKSDSEAFHLPAAGDCSFECAFHILKSDADEFGSDGEVLGIHCELWKEDTLLIYTEDEEGVITLMHGAMDEEGINPKTLKAWEPLQDELFAKWSVIYHK